MGLPEINITFNSKSSSAITRSENGVVALILRDVTNTATTPTITIKSIEDLKSTDWSEDNYDYINKTLLGTPSKVVVVKLDDETEVSEALSKLNGIKFNYLAMPDAEVLEAGQIATWIKSKRTNDKKTVKAVLANQDADDIGVINFTTTGIVVGDKTYTGQQYTGRMAGILAGVPATRSVTYYPLEEVEAITEIENADAAIDNGELILVNDGEKVKIGRGVNSLTTVTADLKEDWKKIKIVDVMDMIIEDIRSTFNDNYVGKVQNTADNQVLFIAAVKSYFKGLAAQSILDSSYNNTVDIDVNAQRLAWESIGTDTTAWDDTQIRNRAFGSEVFLAGNVKIVDAMEDLTFDIFSA